MYKSILVPLDGSQLAECVLPHVESVAKGCGTERVTFIRAVEPYLGSISDDFAMTEVDLQRQVAAARINAEKYLEQLKNATDYGTVKVQTKTLVGLAAESVAEYAEKNSIDLIMIATHGRSGVSRWARGSVADKILHSSCVPVFMVRAPGCIPGI